MRLQLCTTALALCLLATACGPAADVAGPADEPTTNTTTTAAAGSHGTPAVTGGMIPSGERLRAVEVGRRPHDDTAFTQGLEFHEGRLYESRGLRSDDEPVILTEIDPTDGTTIRQHDRPAADDAFYEGLTVTDDRIIQLTWQAGTAYTYELDTFDRTGQLPYEGEGWGICDEPDRLLMTDGTPTLTHRDPATFEVLREVTVTLDGQPVDVLPDAPDRGDQLNEVECVGGLVWANVWQTNQIVVIDPDSGEVVAEVDASAFADDRGRYVGGGADVLNGIAFDPTTGTWLLTGKLWPWMFEVAFECVEGCEPAVTPSHYRRPTHRPRTTSS